MTFSNPVVGGENGELIRAAIRSPNYVTNVSGWTINRDGSAEFNNVSIRLDLTTGSIVVGPPSGPQVRIYPDGVSGLIDFPTNTPGEITPATIRASSVSAGTDEHEVLTVRSAETISGDYARIELDSGDVDGSRTPSVTIALTGISGAPLFTVASDHIQLGGVSVEQTDSLTAEVMVGLSSFRDGNYPMRVAHGRANVPGFNSVTGIGAVDTLIGGAASTSTYLETGVAYEVTVQIRTRSSAGAQAGGLQGVLWKLWDGAVGGTQLGTSIQKFLESDGTGQSSQNFFFVFEHSGSTGSRTVNLSASQFAGTNTLQAIASDQYFMLVKRIGDPAQIINL